MNQRSAGPVDKYVGGRIRMRRIQMGMSQDALAEALGISFQQVQKYEKGTNRTGASRLVQFSNVLVVPVSFFFDGVPNPDDRTLNTAPVEDLSGFLATREGIVVARSFKKIDQRTRAAIVDLIEQIAEQGSDDGIKKLITVHKKTRSK